MTRLKLNDIRHCKEVGNVGRTNAMLKRLSQTMAMADETQGCCIVLKKLPHTEAESGSEGVGSQLHHSNRCVHNLQGVVHKTYCSLIYQLKLLPAANGDSPC